MASITSVISFFILLLATYSYAAPIQKEYGTSTTKYEFTSGATIVEREIKVNEHLISDDESTSEPIIHNERSSEESNSEEVTESVTSPSSTEINDKRGIEDSSWLSSTEINEKRGIEDSSWLSSTEINDKRSIEDSSWLSSTEINDKRGIEDSSWLSSTEINEKRGIEDSSWLSSTEINDKHSIEDFLLSTMESSTEFNRRAIGSVDSREEVETSTHVEPLSSSVDSFGKFTGLLHDDHTEEQSSTSEYETTDQPTTKPQKLTKIVTVIPGKITETKVYVNEKSKKSIVMPPEDETQTSQEHKQRDCLNNKKC